MTVGGTLIVNGGVTSHGQGYISHQTMRDAYSMKGKFPL